MWPISSATGNNNICHPIGIAQMQEIQI